MLNASVVIVYNNEASSAVLRTVHSVVNRSPPELLHEVVLLDDFSDRRKRLILNHQYLGKYALQILPVVITPVSRSVFVVTFCVNVCCHVAKIMKILKKHLYGFEHLSLMVHVPFLYSLTLTFVFMVKTWDYIIFANVSQMVRDRINISITIGEKVWYLPPNGANANVVYRNLDLYF